MLHSNTQIRVNIAVYNNNGHGIYDATVGNQRVTVRGHHIHIKEYLLHRRQQQQNIRNNRQQQTSTQQQQHNLLV